MSELEQVTHIDLMGVTIASVTETELVSQVAGALDAGAGGWVVTANLDILRQAVGSPEIASMIGRSSTIVADGMPLVWASRIARTPLPERVAGSNLILSVSKMASETDHSIYLLGGDEGVAEEAGAVLSERFSGLRVAGSYCPPFGFEKDETELEKIVNQISGAAPRIVFVALGFPKQERLIERIRDVCPNAWWLGVGISFSFVAGEVRRAPVWVQKLGLEWVHRIFQEPRRLFKRYVVHDIPFALWLGMWAIRRRFKRKPAAASPNE